MQCFIIYFCFYSNLAYTIPKPYSQYNNITPLNQQQSSFHTYSHSSLKIFCRSFERHLPVIFKYLGKTRYNNMIQNIQQSQSSDSIYQTHNQQQKKLGRLSLAIFTGYIMKTLRSWERAVLFSPIYLRGLEFIFQHSGQEDIEQKEDINNGNDENKQKNQKSNKEQQNMKQLRLQCLLLGIDSNSKSISILSNRIKSLYQFLSNHSQSSEWAQREREQSAYLMLLQEMQMRMEVIGKWRNDSFSKSNRKDIDEQKEIGNTTEQDGIENQNIHINNNNEQQPFGFGINKQSSQINQLNNLSDEDAETENQMIEQFAKLGDEEEKQLYFHPLIQNDIEYEYKLNEQPSSNTIMKDINTINTASKIIKPKKSQGSWTELSAGKEDEELITTPQNELSPSLPEQKNENIKSETVTGFKMQIQQPSKDKGKDLNKEKELEREREKEIQKRAELDLQRYQQNQLQQQMEQERQNQQQLLNQQLLMRIEFELQQQLSGGYQNQMTNYGYSPQFNSNYFFSNLNNQQQIPQYINQSPSFIPQQSMIFPPHPTQSTIQQNITPGLLQQPHITPGQAQQNGLLPQPQFMQWPQQY